MFMLSVFTLCTFDLAGFQALKVDFLNFDEHDSFHCQRASLWKYISSSKGTFQKLNPNE